MHRHPQRLLHVMTLASLLGGFLWCWGVVCPLGVQGEEARPPERLADPHTLRQQIVAFQDAAALQRFLLAHGLAGQPAPTPMGLHEHDGTFIALAPDGLAVEVFVSNLFGDASPEAILQVRFRHAMYFLSFLYQEAGNWYRVPGGIAINREVTSNAPCGLSNPPGEGYFYFSLVEARTAGEHVIMGTTYGGWCPPSGTDRGSETRLSVWQVTRSGVHRLFDEQIQSFWITSPLPVPMKQPTHQRCMWTPASTQTTFPKKLRCTAAVYTRQVETLPDGSQVPTWVQTSTQSKVYELSYVP